MTLNEDTKVARRFSYIFINNGLVAKKCDAGLCLLCGINVTQSNKVSVRLSFYPINNGFYLRLKQFKAWVKGFNEEKWFVGEQWK